MSSRKTTVNLTADNYHKMQKGMQEMEINQTQFINKAVEGIPIINLGNQRTLAEDFFELRCICCDGEDEKIREEIDRVCRSLNSLMEKIEELKH